VAALAERAERIYAPRLIEYEFANIVRQKMRREGLSLELSLRAIDRFYALPVVMLSHTYDERRSLQQAALTAAARYDLAATYDAQFIALAGWLGCDLWTDDERLAARTALPWIRTLATFSEAH
jgi:predicted nucleic acid-binding protein